MVGLCNNGEIIGAYQDGRRWKIPETSVYTYQREKRLEDEKLPCAVGSTSYVDTVKNCYYVDKTLLIRDLIDDHATVTLFTRPRRFGKTLAMDICLEIRTYTIHGRWQTTLIMIVRPNHSGQIQVMELHSVAKMWR